MNDVPSVASKSYLLLDTVPTGLAVPAYCVRKVSLSGEEIGQITLPLNAMLSISFAKPQPERVMRTG
jgi:hypothetical protein